MKTRIFNLIIIDESGSMSITNTMKFEATNEGVEDMCTGACYSRSDWYDKIERGEADSEEDNKNFFRKWFDK